MIRALQKDMHSFTLWERSAGTVTNVEDEVARSIGAISHEGAPGRPVGINANGRNINAIRSKTVYIEAAEIIVADH